MEIENGLAVARGWGEWGMMSDSIRSKGCSPGVRKL